MSQPSKLVSSNLPVGLSTVFGDSILPAGQRADNSSKLHHVITFKKLQHVGNVGRVGQTPEFDICALCVDSRWRILLQTRGHSKLDS